MGSSSTRRLGVVCGAALAIWVSAPAFADVGPTEDPNEFSDSVPGMLLIVANGTLTVLNTAEIVSDDGSYWLGAAGVVSGITTLVVAAQYDDLERSTLVDLTSVLSIASGTFSMIRRARTHHEDASAQPGGWHLGAALGKTSRLVVSYGF